MQGLNLRLGPLQYGEETKMSKKVSVFFDGYNFYYGAVKGTPYKWLDPVLLVKSMLREDNEIVSFRYFTAPVKTYPHDTAAIDRQKVYLQALSTNPLIKIVQGFYSKNTTWLPVYEESCKTCKEPRDGMIRVVKLEEKRSDVNIATAMLMDAFQDKADVFVLVSGDTDFIGPVNIVRKDFNKTVIVLNPHDRKSWLCDYASYYKDIPRELLAKCQFPDTIPYGKNRTLTRPAAWRE